LKTWCSQHK